MYYVVSGSTISLVCKESVFLNKVENSKQCLINKQLKFPSFIKESIQPTRNKKKYTFIYSLHTLSLLLSIFLKILKANSSTRATPDGTDLIVVTWQDKAEGLKVQGQPGKRVRSSFKRKRRKVLEEWFSRQSHKSSKEWSMPVSPIVEKKKQHTTPLRKGWREVCC